MPLPKLLSYSVIAQIPQQEFKLLKINTLIKLHADVVMREMVQEHLKIVLVHHLIRIKLLYARIEQLIVPLYSEIFPVLLMIHYLKLLQEMSMLIQNSVIAGHLEGNTIVNAQLSLFIFFQIS